jgi:hypothetical protein
VDESPLQELTGRWWDWMVQSWDGWRLRLVADNDLTYHHLVEVDFLDAAYVRVPLRVFSHPMFRAATPDEVSEAQPFMSEDETMRVFAWDTDEPGIRGLVVAEDVVIREGLVVHDG